MSILNVTDISKSYAGVTLFENINFQVQAGEHIALVGDNGSGKSTLLKILAGKEFADSGEVNLASGNIMSYLSQHMDEFSDMDRAVLSTKFQDDYEADIYRLSIEMAKDINHKNKELMDEYQRVVDNFERRGGYSYLPNLSQALNGLGLKGEILNRPIRTLSGGEKMRVLLAEKLLENADLLLLDEPTNHLDIDGLEWLEKFINNYKGAVIVISHDRYFIDRFAERTFEISSGSLKSYKGGYSEFIEQKEKQLDLQIRTLDRLEKELEIQEEVTNTLLNHGKISSYHSREKVVKKLDEQINELKSSIPERRKEMSFKFMPIEDDDRNDKRIIIKAEDLSFAWENEVKLFSDVKFELGITEKKVLVGPNGSGKSTLLSILMGKNPNYSGLIRIAGDIRFAHLGQYVNFPDESLTILEELQERTLMLEKDARNLLARYGFWGDDVFKQLKVLSGGERSRLYLCCIMEEEPDLLYLDEPTNHLDINSREVLESALLDYNGAILAVSHDRYFINKCKFDILGFMNREVREYSSYDSYRHFVSINRSSELELGAKTNNNIENSDENIKKKQNEVYGKESKAHLSNLRKLKRSKEKEIEFLTNEIESLELELENLLKSLSGAEHEQYLQYAEMNEELEAKTEIYFELGEELEKINTEIEDSM